MKNTEWDLVVVGGGAAGFFSALSTAENASRPLKIAIIEKSGQLLGKVKISGGGRCNVTHDCLEPKPLATHYPRGEKSLIGSFHRFGPAETIEWFEGKGVKLKIEKDGRMFPTTDQSQSIIDCLMKTAEEYGIEIYTKTTVKSLTPKDGGFSLTYEGGDSETADGDPSINAKNVLISTGGTRLKAGAVLSEELGHTMIPPVPSLFTFSIDHPLLTDLEGVSVKSGSVKIVEEKLVNMGPILITHWGLSGPGILKLSALAARALAERDYTFTLEVNWCPGLELSSILKLKREEWGKRLISSRSPLASIPKRLWERFAEVAEIDPETKWSQLTKAQEEKLEALVHKCALPVTGKSLNKEEFVTCGGVDLKEVNLKTMESKLHPSLYFAGEVLNIDGVTGGFNFQNAWTGGYHAGLAIAEKMSEA